MNTLVACACITCMLISLRGKSRSHAYAHAHQKRTQRESWSQPSLSSYQDQLISKDEFLTALKSPESVSYFENMSVVDVIARNSTSNSQVLTEYIGAFVPSRNISTSQRVRLHDLSSYSDALCSGSTHHVINELPSISWRFAILQDTAECGMPHTHSNMICLPLAWLNQAMDDNQRLNMVRTLIHEKLHVLQRLRSDLTDCWITKQGYTKVMRRSQLLPAISNYARSNPDLDPYIYARPGKCATIFVFQPSHPRSLSRVQARCVCLQHRHGDALEKYEHPNEMMAYQLSELVTQVSL